MATATQLGVSSDQQGNGGGGAGGMEVMEMSSQQQQQQGSTAYPQESLQVLQVSLNEVETHCTVKVQ